MKNFRLSFSEQRWRNLSWALRIYYLFGGKNILILSFIFYFLIFHYILKDIGWFLFEFWWVSEWVSIWIYSGTLQSQVMIPLQFNFITPNLNSHSHFFSRWDLKRLYSIYLSYTWRHKLRDAVCLSFTFHRRSVLW